MIKSQRCVESRVRQTFLPQTVRYGPYLIVCKAIFQLCRFQRQLNRTFRTVCYVLKGYKDVGDHKISVTYGQNHHQYLKFVVNTFRLQHRCRQHRCRRFEKNREKYFWYGYGKTESPLILRFFEIKLSNQPFGS